MYPQVFGKYILERELSRGGMARVVLATLRGAGGFEKKLVVKQIRDELAFDADFTRRFVEEAKTTVALSHPNIVPVYELGVEQGTYFLAMELVEGVSLAEVIGKGQKLSPDEGAYVGVEVCRALDYAHRKMQVVHRDITPRNVMIDEEGQVKIIDFGIAAPVRAERAKKGEVFGSPGHMPPEQMQGEAIGPPADVFAVGALLLEAWSGKAPFRRKAIEEVEAALLAPHPKPSDADPRLLPVDDVIASALATDPSKRPQQAEELGRALRKFLMGTDSGDIARSLGERVRSARANAKARDVKAAAESGGHLARPPSLGEFVPTKTFAVREEAKGWSEPSPPKDAESGPGTRRIESSAPPPSSRDEREDKRDAPIETLATRPIETPVEPPKKRETPKPAPRPRWPIVAALIAAAAGTVYFARVLTSSPLSPPRPLASSQTIDTPIATVAVPLTPTGTAPSSAASSPRILAAPSVSQLAPAARQAHLALFSDPGTRVRVDGAAWSECPVRDLAVDPGDHDVRFFFEASGESSGKRVTLRDGERVTIRADFAGVQPTITVSR